MNSVNITGLGRTVAALNQFIDSTRIPIKYSTDCPPGKCYLHFRRLFQRITRIRMAPIDGGHRSWVCSRMMTGIPLIEPVPINCMIDVEHDEQSTMCLVSSIETIPYRKDLNLTDIREHSMKTGLRNATQAVVSTHSFMLNCLADVHNAALNSGIKSTGLNLGCKMRLENDYKSGPIPLQQLCLESMGKDFQDEPIAHYIHGIKHHIWNLYRKRESVETKLAQRISEILNPSPKKKQSKKDKDAIPWVTSFQVNKEFSQDKQSFGMSDHPISMCVQSILEAKVRRMTTTENPLFLYSLLTFLVFQSNAQIDMAYKNKATCRVFAFYLLQNDLKLHVIWHIFMFLAPFSDVSPFPGKPRECIQTLISRLGSKTLTYRDILTFVIGPANSVASFITNIHDGSGSFGTRFLNRNR